MMKRVNNVRIRISALVLIVSLGNSAFVVPLYAKQEISAGETGDPGDGFGVYESGGSSTDVGSPTAIQDVDDSSTAIRLPIISAEPQQSWIIQALLVVSHTVARLVK